MFTKTPSFYIYNKLPIGKCKAPFYINKRPCHIDPQRASSHTYMKRFYTITHYLLYQTGNPFCSQLVHPQRGILLSLTEALSTLTNGALLATRSALLYIPLVVAPAKWKFILCGAIGTTLKVVAQRRHHQTYTHCPKYKLQGLAKMNLIFGAMSITFGGGAYEVGIYTQGNEYNFEGGGTKVPPPHTYSLPPSISFNVLRN